MAAFDAYVKFLAMRKHFTDPKYDYHLYNGKMKASFEAFLKRGDKYYFHKLDRMNDPEGHILANMVARSEVPWVSDLFDSSAGSHYRDWRRRVDSLTYTFKTDIKKLSDDLNEDLRVDGGQYPKLFKMYMRGDVSPETVIILDMVTGAFKYWSKHITDDIVFPEKKMKLIKYRSFISVDPTKYKQIILDRYGGSG